MKYFVYILLCADGSFYTGFTTNLEQRLHAHNTLKSGAKYTKTRRPVVLKYSEELSSHSLALKRELNLKKLSHSAKVKLVQKSI